MIYSGIKGFIEVITWQIISKLECNSSFGDIGKDGKVRDGFLIFEDFGIKVYFLSWGLITEDLKVEGTTQVARLSCPLTSVRRRISLECETIHARGLADYQHHCSPNYCFKFIPKHEWQHIHLLFSSIYVLISFFNFCGFFFFTICEFGLQSVDFD